jgi:hypothetical protein
MPVLDVGDEIDQAASAFEMLSLAALVVVHTSGT